MIKTAYLVAPAYIFLLALTFFISPLQAATLVQGEGRHVPAIITAPDLVDFGNLQQADRGRATLQFYSQRLTAGESRTWNLLISEPWLTASQAYGLFSYRTPSGVELFVDASTMSRGFHSASISITSGPDVVRVPVILYVEGVDEREEEPQLEQLRIEPSFPDPLAIGMTRAFRAIGYYSDGNLRDITEKCRWVSDNEAVARFTEPGLLNGLGRGYSNLHVQKQGIRSQGVTSYVDEETTAVLALRVRETSFERVEVNSQRDLNVVIENRGQGRLSWRALATEPWIEIDPDSDREGRQGSFSPVESGRRHTLTVRLNSEGMSAGTYRGSLVIRSNGGDRVVPLEMTVVDLDMLMVTPVRLSLPEGERRRLTATALWSDGSRTDVSSSREGRWVSSNPSAATLSRTGLVAANGPGVTEVRRIERGRESATVFIEVNPVDPRTRLRIIPFEIDLGVVGPGEDARGAFSLRRTGVEVVPWTMHVSEAWRLQDRTQLEGVTGEEAESLVMQLRSLPEREGRIYEDKEGHPLELILEWRGKRARYLRVAPTGSYRDEILMRFDDERTRRVFFSYALSDEESRPVLSVHPRSVALGVMDQGRTYMQRIAVLNTGRSVLSWEAELQGRRNVVHGFRPPTGIVYSLYNHHMTEDLFYRPPDQTAGHLTLEGWWRGKDGFPNRFGRRDTMTFQFRGTGVAVTAIKSPRGGSFRAYLGDSFLGEYDCHGFETEPFEVILAQDLDDGIHDLKIVASREGDLRFEQFRVLGVSTKKGRGNWMRLSPSRGTTTTGDDFINVVVNTTGLEPGLYAENVIFNSNGGRSAIQVTFEVREQRVSEVVPVYFYRKGDDHFLWSELLAIDDAMTAGYRRESAAFNLFGDATPGTAELLAWRHPTRNSWYYSTDRSAGKREDAGYVLKGTIGNIALVPLPNTRELYRLYNAETRRYLYVLDLRETEQRRRGYQYDGIAGYVR